MLENLLIASGLASQLPAHGRYPLSLLQTRSTQEGTCDGLLVEVLAAKDLEKADFFSTTDAYVYVTAKAGGQVVKSTTGKKHPHTPTLRNNENPEWTTENKFCWQSESPVDEVKLAIMDKDSWTSDDPIGHVTVARADFPNYSQEGGAEAEVVSSNKKDKLRFRIVEAGSTTNEAAPNAAGASAPTATPAAASSTSEAGDAPPSENTATTVGVTTTPSAAPETTTTQRCP